MVSGNLGVCAGSLILSKHKKQSYLVGGWATPLQNNSQLGWWHSQYMEKQKMFQATNQMRNLRDIDV